MTKFEILEAVLKSTKDKTISLDQVEKYLRHIRANADTDEQYSASVSKSVVDHFRLLKSKNKSDKALIKLLSEQNHQLRAKNDQLTQSISQIKGLKSTVDRLNSKVGNLLSQIELSSQSDQRSDDNFQQ